MEWSLSLKCLKRLHEDRDQYTEEIPRNRADVNVNSRAKERYIARIMYEELTTISRVLFQGVAFLFVFRRVLQRKRERERYYKLYIIH